MTHDNAEQLPDSFPEKVICYFPGGRVSKLEVCVELFQKDWPHVEYARIRPSAVQPTPASAMDGEIPRDVLWRLISHIHYCRNHYSDTFTRAEQETKLVNLCLEAEKVLGKTAGGNYGR